MESINLARLAPQPSRSVWNEGSVEKRLRKIIRLSDHVKEEKFTIHKTYIKTGSAEQEQEM